MRICMNCRAQIADNAPVCPVCGSPQQMQGAGQQPPMPGYGQPSMQPGYGQPPMQQPYGQPPMQPGYGPMNGNGMYGMQNPQNGPYKKSHSTLILVIASIIAVIAAAVIIILVKKGHDNSPANIRKMEEADIQTLEELQDALQTAIADPDYYYYVQAGDSVTLIKGSNLSWSGSRDFHTAMNDLGIKDSVKGRSDKFNGYRVVAVPDWFGLLYAEVQDPSGMSVNLYDYQKQYRQY